MDYSHGSTDTGPSDAGYDGDRLQLLERYNRDLVGSGRVQAAGFLLSRGGDVFAHQTIGDLTDRPDSPPFCFDSIKGVASLTKLFTATAVMKLVEDGQVWLDQPVKEVVPEFDTPMHGEITLRHLLTHTSGLPADPGYFGEPHPEDRFERLDRDDWVPVVLSGPLQNEPGAAWSYCTLGFIVLAEVVSRVTGRDFDDYVEAEVFRRIGMDRSFMAVPDSLSSEVSLCGEWEEDTFARTEERDPNRPPDGGSGAYSTLYDLYRFGECFRRGGTLDGRRLIGRKTAEEMVRNQVDGVPAFHWGKELDEFRHGLGWGFFADGSTASPGTYCHEGSGWWSLFVDPVEEFVYVSVAADDGEFDPDVMVKPRAIAWSGLQ